MLIFAGNGNSNSIMVKHILLIIIFLVSGCSATNNVTKNFQVFELKDIKIDNNGSYSGYISTNETADSCKIFILKKSEIINFFKQSRIATSREYAHDLAASNCYASGSFTTAEAKKGTWKIDRARRGYINFNSSNNAKYYYCSKCKGTSFYDAM